MTRFRILTACLAVGGMALLATVNAGAQVTKVGDAYLFRAKYAKGKTTRYQMTMQTMLPPGMGGPAGKAPSSMNMTIPITMTVVSVQGDAATIKSDMGAMTMNGQTLSQPRTMQITVDSRGKTIGKTTGAGAGMGLENMSGGLPEKPLKVGQSFTTDKTMNQMGQNLQVKSVSTFMGLKNVGGHQVAEMATKVSSTGTTSMNGTGTSYFNVADGSLLSMKMTTNMVVGAPGQAQKMNMKANMEMKTVSK